MHTELVKMARHDAADLHRKYKEHRSYSEPIDYEVMRAYDLIAQGKMIIRAIESIKQAGLNRDFLPKLALTSATASACHLRRNNNGSIVMSPRELEWRDNPTSKQIRMRANTFRFPADSFPPAFGGGYRDRSDHKAITPLIPAHLRPKRGLQNYSILWEAEWEPVPPTDPYLLRRIGKSDLWLVVAHWDLTEVEKAALSTRV